MEPLQRDERREQNQLGDEGDRERRMEPVAASGFRRARAVKQARDERENHPAVMERFSPLSRAQVAREVGRVPRHVTDVHALQQEP